MTARWIILERTGRWAQEARRLAEDVPILEVRAREHARQALVESPYSLLAVEPATVSLEITAELAALLRQEFPHAALMTLGVSASADGEAIARLLAELGSVYDCPTMRRLPLSAEIVRRHLARAPRPPRTWRQEALDRLPWKASATPRTRTLADT